MGLPTKSQYKQSCHTLGKLVTSSVLLLRVFSQCLLICIVINKPRCISLRYFPPEDSKTVLHWNLATGQSLLFYANLQQQVDQELQVSWQQEHHLLLCSIALLHLLLLHLLHQRRYGQLKANLEILQVKSISCSPFYPQGCTGTHWWSCRSEETHDYKTCRS